MSACAAPALPPPAGARGLFLRERLVLFAAAVACVSALSLGGALRSQLAAALAIAAVAIAMAHGAYDHLQGRRLLQPRFGACWPLLFFSGYAGLLLLTLGGWRLFPLASLLLFLLYSAWHFGLEPERARPSAVAAVCGFAYGALPILASCRWHAAAVAPIFAQMLGAAAPQAVALTAFLGAALWPAFLLAGTGMAAGALGRAPEERVELLVSIGLNLILFAVCEPLPAFAVFFCCWHTPEHLLATSAPGDLRRSLAGNLQAAFGPWLLSLAALGGALALAGRGAAAHAGALFVLLSALTVPHMALDEALRFRAGSGWGRAPSRLP